MTRSTGSGLGGSSFCWEQFVASRRSVRRYLPSALTNEEITRLLQAACWAPSAHNRQPWRFAVIEDHGTKDRLARAMGERLRIDRRVDGDDEATIEADVARSRARITGAPLVILLCLVVADMDAYPDERRAKAEYLMAVQSTAMAAQNLLLAAHAAGLGACWMCAPLFCRDDVSAALALPKGWDPQALITIGKPANAGKPPTRGPLSELVYRP
ncbi:MAG TPA: nitroreductase family protein [Alphaproteobacteria bacterium]|nr:nitroreductase family protein [Alphaproteobacteria bacterium]